MSSIDIGIDTREQHSGFFVAQIIDAGYRPKVEKLPAGDFIIYGRDENDSTLIERKDDSDFLSSLEGKKNSDGTWEKGRLWDQLKRMKETGIKDRWVLIEGNPFSKRLSAYRRKGFNKHRIWGSFIGISKWGTSIIILKNKQETVDFILYLIKKKKNPKKEFTLRSSPPNSMTLREKRLYFLQGLPKIGAKASKEILKYYGSIRKFINGIDELDKLSGIGEKTKREIKKIVG